MANKEKTLQIIKDPEMFQHFMGQTLNSQDLVSVKDDSNPFKFSSFLTKFIGRLNNPGCLPGKYTDRMRCTISREEGGGILSRLIEVSKLSYFNSEVLEKKIEALPEDWYFINRELDLLEGLPKTLFWESDVVSLIDETHPNFSPEPHMNQFTVYRIDYENAERGVESYTLRAGPVLCQAKKEQLVLAGSDQNPGFGPIRLYAAGQRLKWKSLKDEAEFNLLIGKYRRVFNPISKSYKWDPSTAQQMIAFRQGHALVKSGETFFLAMFEDLELAEELMEADLTLDL